MDNNIIVFRRKTLVKTWRKQYWLKVCLTLFKQKVYIENFFGHGILRPFRFNCAQFNQPCGQWLSNASETWTYTKQKRIRNDRFLCFPFPLFVEHAFGPKETNESNWHWFNLIDFIHETSCYDTGSRNHITCRRKQHFCDIT